MSRKLKDILEDIEITAQRDGEFTYINAEMIIEMLEYIIDSENYNYLISEILKINKELKKLLFYGD